MIRKTTPISLAAFTAVFAALWLLSHLQSTQAARLGAFVLYDGTLGGLPTTQNLEYGAADPEFPFTVEATQQYSSPLTILDTTPDMSDYAGYGVTPTLAPVLDRNDGFKLNFSLRIEAETHNSNDRSGFNITFLSTDALGIEIAFWEDEIWAQEGGVDPDLFTHAEGTVYDTTATMTDYELLIIEDIYQLSAEGLPILTGPIRDYSAWEPPFPGLPDPYEQPNLIALSDNTSSAQAETWLSYVAVMTNTAPTLTIIPADLTLSETVSTAVFDVQLSEISPFTVTVNYGTIDGSALAGEDYTAVSGTLTFTPSVTSQSVAIPIIDNDTSDPTRQFQLTLANPAFARFGTSSATITILDDDGGIPLDEVIYLPAMFKP